jgi:hypothetical protein
MYVNHLTISSVFVFLVQNSQFILYYTIFTCMYILMYRIKNGFNTLLRYVYNDLIWVCLVLVWN